MGGCTESTGDEAREAGALKVSTNSVNLSLRAKVSLSLDRG